MTLTINDTTITSDQTPHTARHAPGHPHWDVSWLPGQPLDRNTAITAMFLAETAQAGLDEGHRLWPFLQSWAAELGLTAPDALTRASEPPGTTSSQEPPQGTPDLEDGKAQLTHDGEPRTGDEASMAVPDPEAGQ